MKQPAVTLVKVQCTQLVISNNHTSSDCIECFKGSSSIMTDKNSFHFHVIVIYHLLFMSPDCTVSACASLSEWGSTPAPSQQTSALWTGRPRPQSGMLQSPPVTAAGRGVRLQQTSEIPSPSRWWVCGGRPSLWPLQHWSEGLDMKFLQMLPWSLRLLLLCFSPPENRLTYE